MADQARLYCHVCHHKWNRDQDSGLECPGCHSDFVEMIEHGHDYREDTTEDDDSEDNTDRGRGPRNQLLSRNPWDDAPDPDELDLPHLPRPRIRLHRTYYRSTMPISAEGQRLNDPLLAPIFESFSTIMDTGAGGRQGGIRNRQNGGIRSPARSPDSGSVPPFSHNHDHNHRPWTPPGSGSGPGSPLREAIPGPGFGAGRTRFTATRVWPSGGMNYVPQQAPTENLSGLLGTLLQSINGVNQMGLNGQGINTAIPPIHLIAQLLNPENATHGDAVYTEEALDRVITQFMEQTHGTSAPGPASAEAISGLPKKEADKSMMGSDGKAECSVCMDNVDIGDEVTVLPCGHWFHGDCVGAWLKEHDTCPHCRQGIMPKDVDGSPSTTPRSPGQPPRNNSQSPQTPGPESGRGLFFTVQPPVQPSDFRAPEPQSRQHPHHHHRRRSNPRESRSGGEGSSGGGGGGGLTAWMRERWRGNSDRS